MGLTRSEGGVFLESAKKTMEGPKWNLSTSHLDSLRVGKNPFS